MKIMTAAAIAAISASLWAVGAASPAQADPVCSPARYGQRAFCEDLNQQIVQVQNPDDPTGPPIGMRQSDAALIANPPQGYPNVWTLKPAQSLIDQLNQGGSGVNRILCMGIPSLIRPPNCPAL
jgi:hypothetical protein